VRRNRVRQKAQFARVRSNCYVEPFTVVIQRWIARGERRGKSPIHGWVHQFRGLRKQKFANVMQSEPSFLHRVRYCHCLEVSPMMYFTRLAVEQWVVRRYKLLNDLRSRSEVSATHWSYIQL
jgi:hypothetical protein